MADEQRRRLEARTDRAQTGGRWREAVFTTVSGEPIELLYTPDDIASTKYLTDIGLPGSSRTRADPSDRLSRQTLDDAPVPPASERRRIRMSGTNISSSTVRPACRWHSTCRPSWAVMLTTPLAEEKWGSACRGQFAGGHGDLFRGIDLGQISTSMTINAPAINLMAMYLAVAEKQGVAFDQLRGRSRRISSRVHRQKEWIYPPAPSMRLIVDMFEYLNRERRSGIHLGERLPHPRGRVDGRPGAGVHAGGRVCVCRGRYRTWTEGGRIRPAHLVLLQRPHRLF